MVHVKRSIAIGRGVEDNPLWPVLDWSFRNFIDTFRDVVRALASLEKLKIVHGNIGPQNILIAFEPERDDYNGRGLRAKLGGLGC